MKALLKIAWIELRINILSFRDSPVPRDFLKALFFTFLFALALALSIGIYQSVPQRMMQILLGALPGSDAIPVRVRFHGDRLTALDAPTRRAFQNDARFAGLLLSPYRKVDFEQPPVRLPNYALNPATRKPYASSPWNGMELKGLAIAAAGPADPIWNWAQRQNGQKRPLKPFDRVVIVNRHVFQKHFNYEKYRNFLVRKVGSDALMRFLPPVREVQKNLKALKSLLFLVSENRLYGRLQNFRILWVDGLPLPGQAVFILPLSTYESYLAAWNRAGIRIFPEANGNPSTRIQQINLEDIDQYPAGIQAFMNLADCLGAVSEKEFKRRNRNNGRIVRILYYGPSDKDLPPYDMPSASIMAYGQDGLGEDGLAEVAIKKNDLEYCLSKSGMRKALENPDVKSRFRVIETRTRSLPMHWVGPASIETSCEYVTSNDLQRSRKLGNEDPNIDCRNHKKNQYIKHKKRINGILSLKYYNRATIYVNRKKDIDSIVKKIIAWRQPLSMGENAGEKNPVLPVLSLDPAYESSLVRYGILIKITKALSFPAAILMLVISISFLVVLSSFIISHRKHQYGLLVMSGAKEKLVRIAVLAQFMSLAIVGTLAAWIVANAIFLGINRYYVSGEYYTHAKEIIGLDLDVVINYLGLRELMLMVGAIMLALFSALVIAAFVNGLLLVRHPMQIVSGKK